MDTLLGTSPVIRLRMLYRSFVRPAVHKSDDLARGGGGGGGGDMGTLPVRRHGLLVFLLAGLIALVAATGLRALLVRRDGQSGDGSWLTVVPASRSRPRSLKGALLRGGDAGPTSSASVAQQRGAEPAVWRSRSQDFVNVFLVWASHRDTWGAIQDRVVSSVVGTIPGARVRVLSNTLPSGFFEVLTEEGFDVDVMRYDLEALLQGMPGRAWLDAALEAQGPHLATHVSDFLRLVVLQAYGGMYLDTDALWLRDVRDLPPAFVGQIDFLQLEPTCAWCVGQRWYLPNGVMSFPAGHAFLRQLLVAIDAMPYDAGERTAIGPRFLTTAVLQSGVVEAGDLVLLEEHVLYPIPGPHVPRYFQPVPNAPATVARLFKDSHSVHLFAHTFSQLPVHPRSVFGQVMRDLWPPSRQPLCACYTKPSAPGLCTPASAVIEYRQDLSPWVWPAARLCVKLPPTAQPGSGVSAAVVTITAKRGVVRTWSHEPARSITLTVASPHWTSYELASLEYRHVGDYCNDVVEVAVRYPSWNPLRGAAPGYVVEVPVSAPCITGASLLAPPQHLRAPNPRDWSDLVGPLVPSLTQADLAAQPALAANFSACMRAGSRDALEVAPSAPLRVGLLVSATGTYISWLDGLIASAETHFMRSVAHAEVHYFVLSDVTELPLGPPGRTHLLHQPKLGWPFDSMFRHQLYLKHRAAFAGMDFILVLDADTAFIGPVGEEVLGRTVGALQSFFFGQPFERAPFEREEASSSLVPPGQGRCYFAGGVFGGSYEGFVTLLQRTVWLMEWDLAALGHTAAHDDESYLNKAFLEAPPEVSLGGNYIYPEPPADRAWGLRGVNWRAAFTPRILNLGARKWFDKSTSTDRDYRGGSAAIKPLQLLISGGGDSAVAVEPAAVGVCAPLSGSPRQRAAWVKSLVQSVRTWHSAGAQVVVVDTAPGGSEGDAEVSAGHQQPQGGNGGKVDDTEGLVSYLPLRTGVKQEPTMGAAGTGTAGADAGVLPHCSLAALQLLLSHITARMVLLLDTPSVLTWQSHVAFLQAQSEATDSSHHDGTIVMACPRARDAPNGGRACRLPDGAAAAAGVPAYACSPCDTTDPGRLQRERRQEPAVSVATPMRRLTCWAPPRLEGHALVLLPTALAHNLVENIPFEPTLPPPRVGGKPGDDGNSDCSGIDCWFSRGLAQLGGGTASDDGSRLLSCLPDMSPLLLLDSAGSGEADGKV